MVDGLVLNDRAHARPPLEALEKAWADLAAAIRRYDADIIVLVARKMPRLVETLKLDFGDKVICISDQAIPFAKPDLKQARVAIVDDIWNVGTTMRRARSRVEDAGPRNVRLFALAAKNVRVAMDCGVHLVVTDPLVGSRYQAFVQSVPDLLRRSSKPYDADFPVVPCMIRAPHRTWNDCWKWLKMHYGEQVHQTIDNDQLSTGFARASLNISCAEGWMIKCRLYFDLGEGTCNFVPMALAPTLPLKDVYPEGSLAKDIFQLLRELVTTSADDPDVNYENGNWEALARANTFCDSLMFCDNILGALGGLLQRETDLPFSLEEFSVQYGRLAVERLSKNDIVSARNVEEQKLSTFIQERTSHNIASTSSIIEDTRIVGQARKYLNEGLPILGMGALFESLGAAVGAEDPSQFSLTDTFDLEKIQRHPYLRLKIGLTFQELIKLFREQLKGTWNEHQSIELTVSELIDMFIDRGAIVPTTTIRQQQTCVRVYRKGESNPRWDEEILRFKLLLRSLNTEDRDELLDRGRTRAAKITAIIALSGHGGATLTVGALERGNVGMLAGSVVEGKAADFMGLLRRLGQWK